MYSFYTKKNEKFLKIESLFFICYMFKVQSFIVYLYPLNIFLEVIMTIEILVLQFEMIIRLFFRIFQK